MTALYLGIYRCKGFDYLSRKAYQGKAHGGTKQTHRINSHIQLFRSQVITGHVSMNSKRFGVPKMQLLLKKLKAFMAVNFKKHINSKIFDILKKISNTATQPMLTFDRCHHSTDATHSVNATTHSTDATTHSANATTRSMPLTRPMPPLTWSIPLS